MIRPAINYVHGPNAEVVIIPQRVCAYLEARAGLADFRAKHRDGTDPEVDQVLLAMHIAAVAWRGSATGTRTTPAPEPDANSGWLTTRQAANHLGITSRGVRKAINNNVLPAIQSPEGHWRIKREDIEHYRNRKDTET